MTSDGKGVVVGAVGDEPAEQLIAQIVEGQAARHWGVRASADGDDLRLTELVAAISLATDLGTGAADGACAADLPVGRDRQRPSDLPPSRTDTGN